MITLQEFAARRAKLMQAMGPNSVAIIAAAKECKRNGDSEYRYRQDSNFYYLTGFPEPEAVAVLVPGREKGEFVLFNRERDIKAEVWTGKRAGQEGVKEQYGVDQAFSIKKLDELMPELLTNRSVVHYLMGFDPAFDRQVMTWINTVRTKTRSGVNAPLEVIDLAKILHEMRLYKSPAEIELLRKAAQISASGHRRAMQVCRPGMMEYEIAAELLYEFVRHGCQAEAYSTIVAAGVNACVLHYIDNNASLRDGDLLLVDAGGEYQYYAADITRTFPINGRFTPEQRAIYEIVLKAQLATIALAKPGIAWNELQNTTTKILAEGLLQLGLLQGKLEDVIAKQSYQEFTLHSVSHWLGLDVHDAGTYRTDSEWRVLKPGMVLTVEPGIYIQPDAKVDKKWRNIGVRIEDDVLITERGNEVLSKDVPKEITEIEKLMQQRSH